MRKKMKSFFQLEKISGALLVLYLFAVICAQYFDNQYPTLMKGFLFFLLIMTAGVWQLVRKTCLAVSKKAAGGVFFVPGMPLLVRGCVCVCHALSDDLLYRLLPGRMERRCGGAVGAGCERRV